MKRPLSWRFQSVIMNNYIIAPRLNAFALVDTNKSTLQNSYYDAFHKLFRCKNTNYSAIIIIFADENYKNKKNMLEHLVEFTAWPILTGILVGYIANRIMSGEGKGCCMNLIMGIIGSYVGTFISHLLNIELLGKGYLTNFVFCVVGAVTVLWLWKKIFD